MAKEGAKWAPQGQEVSVLGQGGPQLGRSTGFQSTSPIAQNGQAIPQAQPKSFATSRAANGPRGSVVPMQGQEGLQILSPRLASPQPPEPQVQLAGDEEVHPIQVTGRAPDGQMYEATYHAIFPRGTRILGIKDLKG